MRIQDMFAKDINRSINGVIKVAQDEECEIEQELEEYVITDELYERLNHFMDAYTRSLEVPTDHIGVWISGFFGSGKSHFLKMLSYLLSGRVVAGKPALEYFRPKLEDDPQLLAKLERACSVPCESILFNIDSKSQSGKGDETAILDVFAKVFYDHLGFYGNDLKLARLERYIDGQGKTGEFRAAWEEVTGEAWFGSRDAYDFMADDLVEVLGQVMGMSEETVRGWVDGSATQPYSVDRFVREVREYIDRRESELGRGFRLFFCVDEVGQYIGNDSGRMLKLQTIVEDLGSACAGKAWVAVTSQQAIDEATKGLVSDDFSKIQGRFDTRLSISGSSAAEVIRRRVLEKKPVAADLLKAEYAVQEQVLKNLFTFNHARLDLIGYRDADDFASAFPFASYQFTLLQNVFDGVRRHGSSGKHMSSASRSMLSGFQEAAQSIEDLDEKALVPFWRFYDTLRELLESYISDVIVRCEKQAKAGDQGIDPEDVAVLKLLFLLKYVDKDMPANLNNLTILMADRVDPDLASLRARVQDSLDRLYRQNYIDKTGDRYSFLTNEEQDIAREIADTPAEPADINRAIAQAVFEDIYNAPKVSHGKNDFPIVCYVDEALCRGKQGGLLLRMETDACPVQDRDPAACSLRSSGSDGRGECIVLLPENAGYYENMRQAVKIERYARSVDRAGMTETQLSILGSKQAERQALLKAAREQLEDAIMAARIFIAGEEASVKGSSPRSRIDAALERLIGRRYTKLGLIGVNYTDKDVAEIFLRPDSLDGSVPNQGAVDELESILRTSCMVHGATSVGDMRRSFSAAPYGWRDEDIAACLAELVRARKIELKRAGTIIPANDVRSIVSALLLKSEVDKTEILLREEIDPAVVAAARELYCELADANSAPADDDELAQAVRNALKKRCDTYKGWIERYFDVQPAYPDRKTVDEAIGIFNDVLSAGTGRADVLTAAARYKDDVLDILEDLEDLSRFWGHQQKLFDQALATRSGLERDRERIAASDAQAAEALERIDAIVANQSPYGSIQELPGLVETVNEAHNAVLARARENAALRVEATFDRLDDEAEQTQVTEVLGAKLSHMRATQLSRIRSCTLAVDVEVQVHGLDDIESAVYKKIADAVRAKAQPVKPGLSEEAGSKPRDVLRQPVTEDVVRVSRSATMPLRTLASEEDIEAYVEHLKAELKRALAGHDAVQLIG